MTTNLQGPSTKSVTNVSGQIQAYPFEPRIGCNYEEIRARGDLKYKIGKHKMYFSELH